MHRWKSQKQLERILLTIGIALIGCASPQERASQNAVDNGLVCAHFGEAGYLRQFPDATWGSEGMPMVTIRARAGKSMDIRADSIQDPLTITTDDQLDRFLIQYHNICSDGLPPSFESIPYVLDKKRRAEAEAAEAAEASRLEREAQLAAKAATQKPKIKIEEDGQRSARVSEQDRIAAERKEEEARRQQQEAERRDREEAARQKAERSSRLPIELGLFGETPSATGGSKDGFGGCVPGSEPDLLPPEGGSSISVNWLFTVISLNAEVFYRCKMVSMTPLARQTFIQSAEFQGLKHDLSRLRASLLSRTYRIALTHLKDSLHPEKGEAFPDYNMTAGGFIFAPQRIAQQSHLIHSGMGGPLFAPQQARSGVFLGMGLPTIELQEGSSERRSYVVLRMPASEALRIEKERSSLRAVIDFEIAGLLPVQCLKIVGLLPAHFAQTSCTMISAKNVRISIRNRATEEQIFTFGR